MESIDEQFSFYPQVVTISLTTSQSTSTGTITVPDGMAIIIYEYVIADVDGATIVDFSLSGFQRYFGGRQSYSNDILPFRANPIPLLVSSGNVSVTVYQQSTPISSNNKFLFLCLLCNINDVEEAKRLIYNVRNKSGEIYGIRQ